MSSLFDDNDFNFLICIFIIVEHTFTYIRKYISEINKFSKKVLVTKINFHSRGTVAIKIKYFPLSIVRNKVLSKANFERRVQNISRSHICVIT